MSHLGSDVFKDLVHLSTTRREGGNGIHVVKNYFLLGLCCSGLLCVLIATFVFA